MFNVHGAEKDQHKSSKSLHRCESSKGKEERAVPKVGPSGLARHVLKREGLLKNPGETKPNRVKAVSLWSQKVPRKVKVKHLKSTRKSMRPLRSKMRKEAAKKS